MGEWTPKKLTWPEDVPRRPYAELTAEEKLKVE